MILDKKSLPFVIITTRLDVDPVTKVQHLVELIDTSVFDQKLIAFIGARARHKFTVGEAAPWPEHDLLRPIAEAIERGEDFDLTHADQLLNDWQAAIDTNKVLKVAAPTTVTPTDPTTLWGRMVDAWNVLTGKVILP